MHSGVSRRPLPRPGDGIPHLKKVPIVLVRPSVVRAVVRGRDKEGGVDSSVLRVDPLKPDAVRHPKAGRGDAGRSDEPQGKEDRDEELEDRVACSRLESVGRGRVGVPVVDCVRCERRSMRQKGGRELQPVHAKGEERNVREHAFWDRERVHGRGKDARCPGEGDAAQS